MDKARVVLESDGIYLEESVFGESVVTRIPIMTKEVFVEAFEKWILSAEQEGQK